MAFAAAPEYQVFPQGPEPLDFYEAVAHAAQDTLPLVRELQPDVVVADILTLAPALAAEMDGRPWATMIPHVHPARPPRASRSTRSARACRVRRRAVRCGAELSPSSRAGSSAGAASSTRRERVWVCRALDHVHGGISTELAIVATFPQLEYPRPWPAHVHVVGPLMWEPPAQEDPLGELEREISSHDERPLELVAPSTAQDAEHRLLHAVAARSGGRPGAGARDLEPAVALAAAPGPRQRPGVGLGRLHPRDARSAVVVCHAGHGTLVRALSCGCAVVACPAVGDMNENAARVDWAGAGVRLPRRFISPANRRDWP